ncbi:MAG: SDR family oxidoreductase [Deltaproteobacteria bacterium]|nr:SDR family oxidoreductase [Deltaproteobacteria bacterium]
MSVIQKTFVLTGCASGIGQHLAHMLITRGHHVVATDLNASATVQKLDVTRPEDWEEVLNDALARYGKIDVVMNIAGYLKPGWAHAMSDVEVHRHFDVNTKGVIFGTQAAARHMIRQGQGHIINIASFAALMPVPGLALYSASKYAVRSFSLAVAQELRTHGVDVTVVCPDAVRTPMLDLQANFDQAALTFSTSHVLSVEEIATVIMNRVLPYRPLEVYIPTWRGWIARLGDLFPDFAALVAPFLKRQGRKHQSDYHLENRK